MSTFDQPVIISCSISGAIANREQCPAIPYTPEEYAAEARRAVDEGASQIHIHARTPDGVPSYEIDDFRAITQAILDEVGDVIVNYSTGAIGVPMEKRLAYLRELTPDVAALNMSSMNYAKYSRRRKDFVFKAVFENSFDTIIEFLTEMRELGIKPEHECFDAGHVANLDPLIDMGLVTEPHQISLVMGVTGGIRPTSKNIGFMSEQIPGGPDRGANWQVIGISRDQWRLLATSLTLGGNVRAGLEDNLYLPDGEMARSNGDLIAQGAPDGRGHRPPRRDDPRGARDARASARSRRRSARPEPLPDAQAGNTGGRHRPRPQPPASGRLLLAPPRRRRRGRHQGRGHRHGRLRPLGAALLRRRRAAGARHALRALPRAQPRQALDPPRPEVRRRAARRCCGSPATPTSCSRASGPACSTASASATRRSRPRTRASSTARSRATA